MATSGFSESVLNEFEAHTERVRRAARARRASVQLRAVVDDEDADAAALRIEDTFGVRQPSDRWHGCTNLRTLRALLALIDERGFERYALTLVSPTCLPRLTDCLTARRSAHQIKFHSAFERCVSRVIYKKDWATSRPQIMAHNSWSKCSSEVMIRCSFDLSTTPQRPYSHSLSLARSTPRRFGKTFRYDAHT